MGRVLKYLVYLILLGGIGISAYAVLFDLPAPQRQVVIPVTPAQD